MNIILIISILIFLIGLITGILIFLVGLIISLKVGLHYIEKALKELK